jgi:hypothetical protein
MIKGSRKRQIIIRIEHHTKLLFIHTLPSHLPNISLAFPGAFAAG